MIYSLGFRTTNLTSGQACAEIYSLSTQSCRIMEIGISQSAGVSGTYGLGRPAAQGITPVPVSLQAENDSNLPTSKTNISLSWGTSPTAPSQYIRRITTPATVGAGAIWTFPRGFYLQPNASIVIFNITATQASDVWVVIDE
jgi:hypothetical protein